MRVSKYMLVTGLFVTVSLMGLTTVVAQEYGMAGCGLGSSLISSDGFMQVFAATTNGSSGNQTFGITSGTSNCVEKGVVRVDKEQEAFVEANLDALQGDIAAGGGEYLTGLVELMGCEESSWDNVGEFAQANYSQVFPQESTHAFHALYALKAQMSLDEDFARACTRL